MGATDKQSKANDYAVAMALNESVESIFGMIRLFQVLGPHEVYKPAELNKAYILLVNDLEIIYDRNPKLKEIVPEPLWRKYDIIKDKIYEIQKLLEEDNTNLDHILRVEKLCIIAGQETPELDATQKKHIDDTKMIIEKYASVLVEIAENSSKNEEPDLPNFYIPEFTFTYRQDGVVLINDVLKLKKVHAGSISEHLLEQCVKNPNKFFKPKLGRTSRNISTILSSIGITPIMRQLFFPIVSDDKGVLFRPKVTFIKALDDRISTRAFEEELMKHGAIPHIFTPDVFEQTESNPIKPE